MVMMLLPKTMNQGCKVDHLRQTSLAKTGNGYHAAHSLYSKSTIVGNQE